MPSRKRIKRGYPALLLYQPVHKKNINLRLSDNRYTDLLLYRTPLMENIRNAVWGKPVSKISSIGWNYSRKVLMKYRFKYIILHEYKISDKAKLEIIKNELKYFESENFPGDQITLYKVY